MNNDSHIEITFSATNGFELRAQIIAFLGLGAALAEPDRESWKKMDNINIPREIGNPVTAPGGPYTLRSEAEAEATGKPVESEEVPEAPKPVRRRHRAVRPPVAPQEASAAVTEEPTPTPSTNGHAVEEEPAVDTTAAAAIKQAAMDALQDAFAAGKVNQCRALLIKFGDGAKSFREIELSVFPAIAKAIEAGALA